MTLVEPASLALTSLTCAEYIILPFFDDNCGNAPEILVKLLAVAVISKLFALQKCGYIQRTNKTTRFGIFILRKIDIAN